MITITKQDIFDGQKLDTQININYDITVCGEDLPEFTKELENLINKYKI